jgi:uncharacterized YccA/Bax inhibitor family protein
MVLFVTGAAMLFIFLVVYAEGKIALNDFPRIIAAAFFGVAFNMLTFLRVEPFSRHP